MSLRRQAYAPEQEANPNCQSSNRREEHGQTCNPAGLPSQLQKPLHLLGYGAVKTENPMLLSRELFLVSLSSVQCKPLPDLLHLSRDQRRLVVLKKKKKKSLILTSRSIGWCSKCESGLCWLFRFLLSWFHHAETKGGL